MKPTYIWGAGHYGVLTALDCEQRGIEVAGFIDSNAGKIKTRLGLPCLSLEQVPLQTEPLIIAVQNEETVKAITGKLKAQGIDFEISKLIFSRKNEEKQVIINVGTFNEKNRVTWLKKTLKKMPSGNRILDAGAGECQFKEFCSHMNYVSQDFGKYDGNGDGKSFQAQNWDQSNIDILSDIVAIPEPNNSFDAIMCTEVFEHLPNPIMAIKEFSRLLKFSGKLILTAPFCSLTHFSPYHYSTGFNRYFYEKNLCEFGFKIIEIEENGNFFEYMAQEIRRLESIAYKYSNKKMEYSVREAIISILKYLDECSKLDAGSKELLCFGYHILAEKI
jgi:ubiquinone/menaquinone biosynthesis C-methylase UbiE